MGKQITLDNRQQRVARAGTLTIGVNVVLTAARAVAGLVAGSTAVLADAANSGTDILATLVVLGGSRIAARPPDLDHPYGHEKAEPVAAKLVGILVTVTGVITLLGAIRALRGPGETVGLSAAVVTAASILIKEVLARHLTGVARQVGSQALLADAANQRTDVLASGAALVGALGGRFGLPVLDPAMGLLVAGLIIRMGLGLYWQSVRDLMDRAPEPAIMAQLKQAATATRGVESVDEIKARVFGPGIYVDCKVSVNGDLTVAEGHRIGKRVKEAVMESVPQCHDVLVHVNPHSPEDGPTDSPP
ncbi:MAG: cation diffusion facilitator family transporter [Bacillota bacterium]